MRWVAPLGNRVRIRAADGGGATFQHCWIARFRLHTDPPGHQCEGWLRSGSAFGSESPAGGHRPVRLTPQFRKRRVAATERPPRGARGKPVRIRRGPRHCHRGRTVHGRVDCRSFQPLIEEVLRDRRLGRRTAAADPGARRPAVLRTGNGRFHMSESPIIQSRFSSSSPVSSCWGRNHWWRSTLLPGQTSPIQPFTGEVTVTATGVETDVEEAPTAVTVITRDEIDDAQATSVADMLRRVPGLTVLSSGDEGKLASVFTRGTGSNQTLVMLDGVRLNSPYFGGFDWSRLSTAGLRQVEVVRGPYSALWGADAVGGVINLIPARSRSGFNGRFFGEGGSDGRQRLEADIGWGSKIIRHLCLGLRRPERREPRKLGLFIPTAPGDCWLEFRRSRQSHRSHRAGPRGRNRDPLRNARQPDTGPPAEQPTDPGRDPHQHLFQRVVECRTHRRLCRRHLRFLGPGRPFLHATPPPRRHPPRPAWPATTVLPNTPSVGAASGARKRSPTRRISVPTSTEKPWTSPASSSRTYGR